MDDRALLQSDFVSLSGVGGLLKLLQMQFSSNQLDSCPPVVHGHIRDSWLSIMDVLCQGFSLSEFLEDDKAFDKWKILYSFFIYCLFGSFHPPTSWF